MTEAKMATEEANMKMIVPKEILDQALDALIWATGHEFFTKENAPLVHDAIVAIRNEFPVYTDQPVTPEAPFEVIPVADTNTATEPTPDAEAQAS